MFKKRKRSKVQDKKPNNEDSKSQYKLKSQKIDENEDEDDILNIVNGSNQIQKKQSTTKYKLKSVNYEDVEDIETKQKSKKKKRKSKVNAAAVASVSGQNQVNPEIQQKSR